ncbi:LysR family transcriptional regulator [Silvibacterium dinghuense]|uniref:LysR family transcriptional regulator n=1 Tax=Silvibacterium dinghuense TaxID=1560006 RepID=A0A4Q1SAW0_9BACT|nr:LysR family transcriptional regulator [Silvibacterium dinghuense]RXS93822.1 LysR family transcriptional regulator [Silvibacterium dinghuense]GGH07972.1 HTH-type transcriptional regulator AlsR [Silvibacterium dinghuense]
MDLSSIELRHLRYFVAVAEELHFGRAAQRLHIAQPPLSQQIRRLEEMLGCTLFLRTSREVRLTAAGEELLERSRQTLRKIGDDCTAALRIGRGEAGVLRVGFIGSGMLTALPRMLGRYRRLYPEVDLQLREFSTSGLVQELRNGTVDVGFLRDAGPVEELHIEPVFTEPFVAAVAKRHRLAEQKSISPRSLRDEPFVLFSRSYGDVAWRRTVALCEAHGYLPNVVQEAPQWLTILSLVGAGLGVTIAPACVERLRVANTVCLRLREKHHSTSLELAYRDTEKRPIVLAFAALAREIFKKGIGGRG